MAPAPGAVRRLRRQDTLVSPGEGSLSDFGRDYRVPGVAATCPSAIQSDELDKQRRRRVDIDGRSVRDGAVVMLIAAAALLLEQRSHHLDMTAVGVMRSLGLPRAGGRSGCRGAAPRKRSSLLDWAVDFRNTPSRRAGGTTTTSAPAGARRVVYVADRLDPAARPRASPNPFHARDVHRAVAAPTPREKTPPKRVFSLGLSVRPARPIAFAVVATMRTGFKVGPRVGRQERTYRRRRRWAEASRRSSPPLSLCTGAHDRPR